MVNKVNIECTLAIGTESIVIKKGTNYRLVSLTGVETPEFILGTDDYATDGGYITGGRYGIRKIGVEFAIDALASTESLRQGIIAKLQAKKDAVFTVKRNNKTRSIGGRLSGEAVFTQKNYVYDRVHIAVTLLCPDPFFSEAAKSATFTDGSAVILNGGQDGAGFLLTLTLSGNVTDPVITLDDDKFIKAKGDFVSGDVITVSTEKNDVFIKKNGTEYLNYDPASDFFLLPEGSHTVAVSAASGAENIAPALTYKERFIGV